jgi:hypothetical protein
MQPDVYKRVVNAKYVLERAVEIRSADDDLSLSIALLLIHDAVELLMLAVIDHLQIKTKGRREFMDFWDDVKQAKHPEPPDRIPMESLNKLRISLKHYGIMPQAQAVIDLVPRVQGFFENVLTAYCDARYSDVSLIDLIADKEVCGLLREAQEMFRSGDKPQALAKLKIAFGKVEHPSDRHLPLLHSPAKPRLSDQVASPEFQRYLKELDDFLRDSALVINAVMLGVNPARYSSFLQNTPNIMRFVSGKINIFHKGSYEGLSEGDFNELIDFLIDYALKASEAYLPLTADQRMFREFRRRV